MPEAFADGLFLPAMVLALIAWVVPKLLSMVMPEGIRPLLLLAFLSSLILFALSAGFFFVLYLWRGIPLDETLAFGFAANIVFFGRLGLVAAIIWAPIMVLSVAAIPRTWKKEVW